MSKHLENHLFTWEGWDDNGPMCLQFYKVELVIPIGEFPVGKRFATAFLDGDKSIISFEDENGTYHSFEVSLTVGKKIETVNHE